jgi:hypothetical protein
MNFSTSRKASGAMVWATAASVTLPEEFPQPDRRFTVQAGDFSTRQRYAERKALFRPGKHHAFPEPESASGYPPLTVAVTCRDALSFTGRRPARKSPAIKSCRLRRRNPCNLNPLSAPSHEPQLPGLPDGPGRCGDLCAGRPTSRSKQQAARVASEFRDLPSARISGSLASCRVPPLPRRHRRDRREDGRSRPIS